MIQYYAFELIWSERILGDTLRTNGHIWEEKWTNIKKTQHADELIHKTKPFHWECLSEKKQIVYCHVVFLFGTCIFVLSCLFCFWRSAHIKLYSYHSNKNDEEHI